MNEYLLPTTQKCKVNCQILFSINVFTTTVKLLHAHWIIFIVNMQTDTRVYNLCNALTSKCLQIKNLTMCNSRKYPYLSHEPPPLWKIPIKLHTFL